MWISLRTGIRLAITFVLLVVLTNSNFSVQPKALANTNCTPSNHCYSAYDWPGGSWGAATLEGMRNITCIAQNGCYAITNELWLTNEFNQYGLRYEGCDSGTNICWIELGHVNKAPCPPACPNYGLGGLGDVFYWAQNNPNTGYEEHSLGLSTSDDDGNTWFEVYNYGGCNYQLVVYNLILNGTSPQYPTVNNCFTPGGTARVPGHIKVGMEYFSNGTSTGGAVETATYNENQWMGQPNGIWSYQGTNGNSYPEDNAPLVGGWALDPPHSSEGGTWYSSCVFAC